MSSSSSPRTLATMPPEVHYHVLTALASFQDLGATVLAARPLHAAFDAHRRKVLSSVGRNFLGALFTDALLLARCLEKRDGSEALKVKGLSGSTVRLLVQNADTVGALQAIVFGLLKEDSAVDKPSLTKFAKSPRVVVPSESESIRLKSAAYRFCVYCLLTTSDARIAFLNRFPKIQILELSHFVTGLWTLVSVIRGRPLDTDQDWELASNVLSTGPHSVLALWKMKQEKAEMDKAEFKAALKVASASSSSSASVSSPSAYAYYDGEDEGESFMGAWCDLMEAQRFPAAASDEAQTHTHALDAGAGAGWQAILDAGNARALTALAFAEQEEKDKRDKELLELEEAEPVVQPENRKKVNGKGKQKKRGGLDDPFC